MKIFVTRRIPGQDFEKLLSSEHEVLVSDFDRALTAEELIEKIQGVDVILSLLTDKIDGEVMDVAGPQLKLIANYAVGFDNINVEEATQRGIVVTNTPSDRVNEAVAEHTWALILCLTRRIVESDEATRDGGYKGWEPDTFLGPSLVGKSLGILGLGRIGSMVAARAKAHGMKIFYYQRNKNPEVESQTGAILKEKDALLSESDIVTLHVPLTDETRHLINAEAFAKMKPGSYLINTARGPIIREKDLVEALRSGHLAGVGLDVFENEPNIHPELLGMENVVLTPHTASATYEAREEMATKAVTAIFDVLAGHEPETIVNKEVWEKRRK